MDAGEADREETGITATCGTEPAAPVHFSDLPRGSSLGRYVILEPLGKGGMGAVYSAYDSQLDRRVALKLLRTLPQSEEAEELRARLLREAQAMARLSHPNVVTVYEVTVATDGRVFLAMEIVEKGTLAQWLKERERPWREILRVMCDAGEGLAAAHRAGMIHRDFKLDNVLMAEGDRPKVTDFGLARAAERGPRPIPVTPSAASREVLLPPAQACLPSGSLSMPLTMTGSLLGTPGYMAPEQYGIEEEIDARADVFSFCATVYRALYGERPFEGKTIDDIAIATLMGRVRAPPPDTDVPLWLRRVILRGLSVEREARPASMDELLVELRADPAKRRRRWLALAAVVAAGCATVLGVQQVGQHRVRACHAMADRLGGVWDGPRKEAVAGAFRATGIGYAAGTWAKVEQSLDAYAHAWSTSMEQACTATRVRREASEAALELRAACLEERLDGLRALGDVLAKADAKTVEDAPKAVSELSRIEWCSDLDRLSASSRLPADATARSEVRQLQRAVAEAKVLADTGKRQQALERLLLLRDRVAATGYGPLRVAWTQCLGRSKSLSDAKAAAEDYEEAIVRADAYRLDEVKAETALGLAEITASWLDRYDDARRWLHIASGAIERIGGDPVLEAKREIEEGWLEAYEYQTTDVFQKALDLLRAAHADTPSLRGRAHAGMAAMLSRSGRPEEAIPLDRLAIQDEIEVHGGDTPTVAMYVDNLALDLVDAGHFGEALAQVLRALAIIDAETPPGIAASPSHYLSNTEAYAGRILLRMRRASEAIEHLVRARDMLTMTDGLQNEDGAIVDTDLAEAHLLLGHKAEARGALDEAESIERQRPDLRSEAAGTLVVRARLALDEGKGALALLLAEQALALQSTGIRHVYEFADAQLATACALASTHKDATRARDLAEQAREAFLKRADTLRVDEAASVLAKLR